MATFGKIGAANMMHKWTTKDYVQDGLIAMWDGIENIGAGTHDSSSKVWKDVTGNGYDLSVTSNGAFGENCFISKGRLSASGTKFLPNYYTIEITLQPTTHAATLVFIPQNKSSVRVFAVYTPSGGINTFLVSSGKGKWKIPKNYGDVFCCAATYSGDTPQKYYVDGIITTQYSSDTWGGRTVSGVTISDVSGYYYYGQIYSIRTYSRALSQDELIHNNVIDKIRFEIS